MKDLKGLVIETKCKVIENKVVEITDTNAEKHIRELPDSNYQRVKRLFDGRNFYDQSISDSNKQYNEVKKASTGQGDDYTTVCSLDCVYFEKKKQITCC